MLGWVWSLLIAALVTFAGAIDFMFLANKRSKDPPFYAMRWLARRLIGDNTHTFEGVSRQVEGKLQRRGLILKTGTKRKRNTP